MVRKKGNQATKLVWAYAYQILPPQTADGVRAIQDILDQEHAAAQRDARIWAGRITLEQRVTLILVVSDRPEQSRDVNRRIEAELRARGAEFAITASLAVADDAAVGLDGAASARVGGGD